MRQINIFINIVLLFFVILFIITFIYITTNDNLLYLIIKSHIIKSLLLLILYKIIYFHSEFVISAFAISLLLFYGFSPTGIFKSKHYKIFIIFAPLIIAGAIFYFENFYFINYRDYYTKMIVRQEKNIFRNIDYTKFFNTRIEKFGEGDNQAILLISKKNRRYVEGFIIHNNNLIKAKKLTFNLKKSKLIMDSLNKKIVEIDYSTQENLLWQKLKYRYDRIFPFVFLIFIFIPLALLFNNRNWYLRTIIFLIIAVPLYLYAFTYFNKLIFSIKLNIKLPVKWLDINDIILSISYIIIGNILFKIADSVRNIKTRIELEKVKRISH